MNQHNERSAFERWARAQPWIKDLQRYDESHPKWPGQYGHCDTEHAWNAWQACRAAMLEAQPAEQANGLEVANPNKYAEFWERLPGYLIDHHEGDILTEELLQRAAADLYAKFPDFVASGLKPFGLLLLEEKATTRELVRALREATEPPTFMGEPITTPPAQPAREWVGLTDEERDSIASEYTNVSAAMLLAESKLREKNAGL